MPLTSLSVSSYDFSGQIRPSKPSGMPMTLHLYLRKAALTAARMTALRPGASPPPVQMPMRSEEHTSELQSPCNLVCRLLLEKKKTTARAVLHSTGPSMSAEEQTLSASTNYG